MNEQPWMAGPPACLLLATDLSARCDRAIDRAAQLAGEWRAKLVVLNVLETPQAPDLVLKWANACDDENCIRIARRQIQRDLASLDIHTDIRIVRGETSSVIRETAIDANCGLIVTGMARNEILGRFLIGSTVERLARTVPQPLLVVRNRVHNPYRRIIVATDFSDSSRHALNAAIRFFPGRELILYHAHTAPLSETLDKAPNTSAGMSMAKKECSDFLSASNLPDDVRSRLQVVIEYGALETALVNYVREHDMDLVVMGTHGRSGLMNILLGSAAARLLDWLPSDTMIVREPQALT